jgi:hypothetical protein
MVCSPKPVGGVQDTACAARRPASCGRELTSQSVLSQLQEFSSKLGTAGVRWAWAAERACPDQQDSRQFREAGADLHLNLDLLVVSGAFRNAEYCMYE